MNQTLDALIEYVT